MLWAVFLLFLALAAAGAVVLYVAYPHRGQELPYAPALGTAIRNVADSVPTLDEGEVRAHFDARR